MTFISYFLYTLQGKLNISSSIRSNSYLNVMTSPCHDREKSHDMSLQVYCAAVKHCLLWLLSCLPWWSHDMYCRNITRSCLLKDTYL